MRSIRCDHCGRELAPGDATTASCPSCGRAMVIPTEALTATMVAQDDASTQPVPPEVVAAFAAADAPRAGGEDDRPTAPPPPPADPRTAAALPYSRYEPPSLPRSPAAGNAPSVPQAEPAAVTPVASGGDAPATPSGKDGTRAPSARLTTISAVTLLLVLVLGTGITVLAANGSLAHLLGYRPPTPLPTATSASTGNPPTALPGFQRYTATDGSFALDVPAGWSTTVVPRTGGLLTTFVDLSTGANFEIDKVDQTADPTQHDALAVARLADALAAPTQGKSTVMPGSTTDTIPLTGTLWTRETVDISVTSTSQSTIWHVVALATPHNNSTLLVLYFAPQAAFPHEDASAFQPMVNSLQLVSTQP